jgi:DNA-binding HxlR family transcriptional regulator
MKNITEMKAHKDWKTCPVEYTKERIAGKWKLMILWHVYDNKVLRYGDLKRLVNGITHKMLSNQLKELVSYDLIHKEIYTQVPPKTEYSLTSKGESIVPILDVMFEWGKNEMARK